MKILSKNFPNPQALELLIQDCFLPTSSSIKELDKDFFEYALESKLKDSLINDSVVEFKARIFSDNKSIIKQNKSQEISLKIVWNDENQIEQTREIKLETARSNDLKTFRLIKAVAKQTMSQMLIAIAACSMINACGKGTPETEGKEQNKTYSSQVNVDGEAWKSNTHISDDEKLMIQRIIDQAEENGVGDYVKKNVNNFSGIEWVEQIGDKAGAVLGRCTYADRKVRILKPQYMKKAMNNCFNNPKYSDINDDDIYVLTELVLWHELGHCAGDLEHNDTEALNLMNTMITCEHIEDFKVNNDQRINAMISAFKDPKYGYGLKIHEGEDFDDLKK